jgi:endonuclease
MAVQRHNVVISKSGGGVEVYPMKDWLREHPEENPTGRDPGDLTSHQLQCCTAEGGMVNKTDGN